MTIPNQLQEIQDIITAQRRDFNAERLTSEKLKMVFDTIYNLSADYSDGCAHESETITKLLAVTHVVSALQLCLERGELRVNVFYDGLELLDEHLKSLIKYADETVVYDGGNVLAFKKPARTTSTYVLPSTGGDAA